MKKIIVSFLLLFMQARADVTTLLESMRDDDLPLEYVRFLFKDIKLDAQRSYETLLYAIQRGNVDMISCLIKGGIDMNYILDGQEYVWNPLELAQSFARDKRFRMQKQARKNIVKLLERAGARDRNGDKALFY